MSVRNSLVLKTVVVVELAMLLMGLLLSYGLRESWILFWIVWGPGMVFLAFWTWYCINLAYRREDNENSS